MSTTPTTKAPKSTKTTTVVSMRTPAQVGHVKAAAKMAALKDQDEHLLVPNAEAQVLVDRVIAASLDADCGIFTKRVLDYFVAELLLTIPGLTDSRNTLHSRLVRVGATTPGFTLTMKQDGTLLVSATTPKFEDLGQREAMAILAPDQVKAPKAAKPAGESKAKGSSPADDESDEFGPEDGVRIIAPDLVARAGREVAARKATAKAEVTPIPKGAPKPRRSTAKAS